MTNHRDPIEDWLSRDVEVLPPPPGSFERVRSRARRRKAMQAASAAAGVAVILAAGISVPALTGNLFQGTGPSRVATSATATSPRTPSSTSTSLPQPAASPRSFHGPALPDVRAGGTAPAGFRPSSVTVVGNHGGYLSAVLGQAPCGGHSCIAIAGAASYGGPWATAGVPPAGPRAVSQIRFADPENGWAFGPALYATHDGGAHWKAIGTRGGSVIDLAAVGNRAFAVIGHGASGCGATSASVCNSFTLMSATATSDSWRLVTGGGGSGQAMAGGLQLTPAGGFLLAGGRLYAGPVTAGAWHAVAVTSPGAPACLADRAAAGVRLIAAGQGTLYLACGSGRPLTLYQSGNGGRTWQDGGAIPAAGTATSLAVSPSGTLVLATTQGLYYAPGGRSWRPAASGSGNGVAFRYVGMTTARLGVAIPANAGRGVVYVTRDGGRTWQASPVSR